MLNKKLLQKSNHKICPIVVISKNGKLLSGLRAYKKDLVVWTFPGGRCEEGETVEQTLIREVEKETGINDLKIIDFLGEAPGAKEGDIVYIFHGMSEQDPILREPEKFLEYGWKFPKEITDNFINTDVLKLVLEKLNVKN